MKVKALTNIKCGADWHYAGEVFEIHEDAFGEIKELVERVEASTPPQIPDMDLPVDEHPQEEKPKRTARKRKE